MTVTTHPRGRSVAVASALALACAGLAATSAGAAEGDPAPEPARADQVLTWTADDSTTEYASFPTEASAGPATIVLENNESTGNTSGMQHTVTFDTATDGYNHDVEVDLLAYPDDGNDGVAEADVELTEGTYLIKCVIPGHGQMTTELEVTDDGGGGGGDDDTTAPEVSLSIDGDTDDDGAYVGAAAITLTATDDDSGVDVIEYQLDGGDWTEYSDAVEVTDVGEHTLAYRATDKAGNTSEAQEEDFTVAEDSGGDDTTPPQVKASIEGETNADGDYLGTAAVTLSATDGNSGVDVIEYQLDGGDWTEYSDAVEVTDVGEHTLAYRATDKAGNTSEVEKTTFTVAQDPDDDTDAPEVTVTVTGNLNSSWEYVGMAMVAIAADDGDGSGVDTLEYTSDGKEWKEYSEPIHLEDAGSYAIGYRATDEAGNTEEGEVSLTVVSDESNAPTCANPDPSPTVVIGTVGTGVRNRVADGGTCTIDDLIKDEARWSSHEDFLAHVEDVLADLAEDGIVTDTEAESIRSAAERSSIGR